MERKPPTSVGDFVAVIQRRKYWIIIPAAVVIVLAVLLAPMVPRTYMSTTTIMVQPQQVPTAFVKPVSTVDMANRIHTIQLEVMSGPDLVQVINSLNLYPALRKQGKMNRAVAAMAKDITVAEAPDSSDGRGGVAAFTISYIGRSPKEAQQVTKALADLYIRENLNESHQQAQGTASFLDAQVAEAGQKLAAQQARIQAFKEAHLGSLPEQAAANIQMVGQYQAQLQTNSAAIEQDNQQRVYLESVLNVNPNGDQGETPVQPSPLQVELAQKQAELHADLLKYTPEHPDIIRLQHDIAALKVEIHQAPKSTGTSAVAQLPQANGPSQTDLLRGQLIGLNSDLKSRNARQRELEQKISQLQGAFGTVPAVQTEYSALDSKYQQLQKDYNLLLEKQQEASMGAALDQKDAGEQFVVIQPANLPSTPFRPNPALLYLGSVLVALLVGFLCALLVELRDDTMHSSAEVAAYLKLPVIVDLPKCPPFSDEAWKVSAGS